MRAAYETGESGPSCARRFDVGLANLRKKARREGWTRRHVAARLDRELPSERITVPAASCDEGEPVDRQAALHACLDHAATAMALGEGPKALAALRAAMAFTELTRRLESLADPDGMERGRQAALAFLRAKALEKKERETPGCSP